jgi:hypothetical protein
LSNKINTTRGTELARQMQAHGMEDPEELTEFDIEWVNSATLRDIETTAAVNNWEVFGLKFWNRWPKVRGKDLLKVLTFGVDLIILNRNEAGVDRLIANHEKKQAALGDKYSSKITWEIVEALAGIALMHCTWI